MTLPYYARKEQPFESSETYILFHTPEIKQVIGHITKRPISLLPPPHIENIISSYLYAKHSVYLVPKGVEIWKNIIEIYFELINLTINLGKHIEMRNIYLISMKHVAEGQQDLFYCQEQLDKLKNESDVEVRFKLLMDKYFTLHEKNVKYLLSLAIFCLDQIMNHKDLNIKSVECYCEDDVSYKISKLKQCQPKLDLKHDLDPLLLGIEPHIRNAIGHKRIKYGEENNLILSDRDGWNEEYKIEEFEKIVESLFINFHAQASAVVLFCYEYQEKLELNKVKSYTSLKELRTLINIELEDSFFDPVNILFIENNTKIVCDVKKRAGFDFPSELMGNLEGVRFHTKRASLKADEQSFRVILGIAHLNTDFEECQINIVDYNNNKIGCVRVNLRKWTNLVKDSFKKEDLNKYIVENTFQNS
jgi:hypothetical protein